MKREYDLQEELDEYAFWLKRALNDRLLRTYGTAYPQKPVLWVNVLTVTLLSSKRSVTGIDASAFDKKISQEV